MRSKRSRLLLIIIVVVGIALRVAQWGYEGPLWHDESAVVHNIEGKTAAQLLGPLWESVAAPPGFLLTLRSLYKSFGHSSLLYRLPALVAGSGALILIALLAARLLVPAAALTMTALFALSDRLIWHSVEVKPYAIDTCVACLLLWLFFYVKNPARRIAILSLVAAISIWFSFPTAFVYGGLMIVLLAENYRNRRCQLMIFAGGILFTASTLAVYFLDVRPQRTAGLRDNWIADYLPASPIAWPRWLIVELYRLCDYSTKNMGGPVLILAVMGVIFLWQHRERRKISALLLPLVLTLAGACAAFYPFGGSRVTLFLVPAIFLLCGFGLQFLVEVCKPWGAIASTAISVFLVIWMAALAGYHVWSPRMRTPAIRELAAYIHAHYRAGEPIYVWAGRNGPDEFIDYWDIHVGRPGDPLFPLRDIKYTGRFWIVLIDATEFRKTFTMPDLAGAKAAATEKRRFATRGGHAYLFEHP